MLPIASIPQALSAYGIQMPDIAMPQGAPKMPDMDGTSFQSALKGFTSVPPATEGITAVPPVTEGITSIQPSSDSFGAMLGKFVQDVNTKQTQAGDAVASLQSGGNASLHQAVIAMEEANVSFQLMVEVRNKLLESYQEIMRMSV